MTALNDLWAIGGAWRHLLDTGKPGSYGATRGGQQGWMERWHAHDDDAVNGSGRQRGKTFTKYAMLDEHMRKFPGSKTRFCALTIDSAQALLAGAMGDPEKDFSDGFLATCPTNLKPYRDGYDWVFPGASRMIVMGTDAQTFRRGRGFSRIEREVRDEFGLYQDLDGVEAALNLGLMVPGLSGKPGRCWRASTPGLTPAHPSKLLVDAAKASGRYELETFYDNPRVDPEVTIRKEMTRLGQTREEFLDSTYFKREYLGLWVTEETRAAAPAWTDEVAKACTLDWPRPTHFHGYTGHDWGGQTGDPHAGLFGYLDFKASKLIIEYEHEKRGIDTPTLTQAWKDIETACYGERKWDGTLWGAGEFEKATKTLPDFLRPALIAAQNQQPFLRLCDADEQLQKDMMVNGYAMLTTRKDDKHLMVDNMNALIRQRRIIINPRCRRLLTQLGTGLWNKTRSEWERTPLDHCDLIDCLVYITRNVFWHHDPFPPPVDTFWGEKVENPDAELARAMTGGRRRR